MAIQPRVSKYRPFSLDTEQFDKPNEPDEPLSLFM